LTVQPELEGFETLDEWQSVKVVSEGCSRNPLGERFDSFKNIGRFSKIDPMGKVLFLRAARQAHIDLDQVRLEVTANQKVKA